MRILLLALCLCAPLWAANPYAIAIHGGAGTIERSKLSAEQEREIRAALEAAARAGEAVLADGGSALDAVSASVVLLEDSPWFNAGKGAVFNAAGENELDAAIMDGHTLAAGAVAGLKRTRNPILLARAVMERSPHVMMIGAGAEEFGLEQGIEQVDPAYFHTERRWQQYLEAKAQAGGDRPAIHALPRSWLYGTVGAVALDQQGRLAAATSTGGMTLKRYGRVGDAPIIGAGTYADDRCAVSATGWGEFFIRLNVAHDICARVRYGGVRSDRAARSVVMERVPALGGNGGVIVIDRQGRISMPFNTSGMYRAAIDRDGELQVAIYADE